MSKVSTAENYSGAYCTALYHVPVAALLYTARLRVPEDTTDLARRVRVDKVISQMGLDHARYTIVGTPLKKGISGGERKRLAVGLELLTSPKLLFLDEPTSGEW